MLNSNSVSDKTANFLFKYLQRKRIIELADVIQKEKAKLSIQQLTLTVAFEAKKQFF